VEVLVTKSLAAAEATGAMSVCLAGGVAANGPLREQMAAGARAAGLACFVPSRAMCTDNAAMIGAAAHVRLAMSGPSSLGLGAEPNLAFPGLDRRPPRSR
jgi:N6-L-threonylcarbamoyladenine synthase